MLERTIGEECNLWFSQCPAASFQFPWSLQSMYVQPQRYVQINTGNGLEGERNKTKCHNKSFSSLSPLLKIYDFWSWSKRCYLHLSLVIRWQYEWPDDHDDSRNEPNVSVITTSGYNASLYGDMYLFGSCKKTQLQLNLLAKVLFGGFSIFYFSNWNCCVARADDWKHSEKRLSG